MIPVSQSLVAAEFLHGHYRASIMPWCVLQPNCGGYMSIARMARPFTLSIPNGTKSPWMR